MPNLNNPTTERALVHLLKDADTNTVQLVCSVLGINADVAQNAIDCYDYSAVEIILIALETAKHSLSCLDEDQEDHAYDGLSFDPLYATATQLLERCKLYTEDTHYIDLALSEINEVYPE